MSGGAALRAAALSALVIVVSGCGRGGESTAVARRDAAFGERIFLHTETLAAALGSNGLACTSCHLEGGRMAGALELTGAAASYPRKDASNREITLEDRIERCFAHSLAGRAPEKSSEIVAALAAYVGSIARPGVADPGGIPAAKLRPITELNAGRGRALYDDLCSGCHGLDGQGYRERRKPLPYESVPPVWGPRSYDDASGLARVHRLAGFLRRAMPRDEPGTLDDEDAQDIAAFVDGQPRPAATDKRAWDGSAPADAVYDTARYPANPFRVPLATDPGGRPSAASGKQ
jgi:thiosulfate dehydrogenase